MKKYLFIFKSELMSELQYVFDMMIGFISYGVIIFIYFNLWNYMYDDPSSLINGYSVSQMIWYVCFTEILWMSLSGRKLCKKICDDVKVGNVLYQLNKPYSYIGYVVSNHFGLFFIRFFLYLIFGFLLGSILLGNLPKLTIISVIYIFISSMIATFINMFITISIALISFFVEDANPFYWVYSKLILVVGTLFPIEFFPGVIQPIIRYSPIYVVTYGPAKLFVDFSYQSLANVLISQAIYLVLTYLFCLFIYKKGVKKINVNGG